MHILFASHSAELMGAERSLLALVREAVRERGHRVTVMLPGSGPLGALLSETGAGVVVLPTRLWMGHRYSPAVGAVRCAQAVASVPRYRRYLTAAAPDLVVTNSAVVPAAALAARSARLPHVWVVRESLLSNPSLRSVLPRRVIARRIVNLSAAVVAVSGYVADQVTAAVPGARVRVIPPPVEGYPDGPVREAGQLRRLLLLGRYTPEKGHADAIAALGVCRREGYPVELTLAGVGDAGPLRDLARVHGVDGHVTVREWDDDPGALYRDADATLMLSRNEAYGRVTVESLMNGTPVIGFRCGATTEILAAGGGVLVDPSSDALARAVMDLADDPTGYTRLKADALRRRRQLREAPPAAAAFLDYVESLRARP